MSASVLYMSMSLDGYIAGPNDEPGNPGGDGFDRLHEWFVSPDGPGGQLWDEMHATGAVLAGRRTSKRASCQLERTEVIETPAATNRRFRLVDQPS